MFFSIPVITLTTLSLLLFCFQSGCKHITCLNEGHCYFNEDNRQFQCKCNLPWIGDSCEKKTGTLSSFFKQQFFLVIHRHFPVFLGIISNLVLLCTPFLFWIFN